MAGVGWRLLKAVASTLGLWHGFLAVERHLGWRRHVIVLVYHHISTPEEHERGLSGLQAGTPDELFAEQMKHLGRWYRPTSMDELEAMVLNSVAPSEDLFVVTFDDAYASVGSRCTRLLASLRICGHVFVATGFVETGRRFWWVRWVDWLHQATPRVWDLAGNLESIPAEIAGVFRQFQIEPWENRRRASQAMLAILDAWQESPRELFLERLEALQLPTSTVLPVANWEEIRGMIRSGFSLGAHSHTHPRFGGLPADVATQDLEKCNSILERETGILPRTFAWPSGDFSETSCRAARQAGYTVGFTTRNGSFNGKLPDAMQFPRTSLGHRRGRDLVARLAWIKFQKYLPFSRRASEKGPRPDAP
jgi:peptidoglycan/xylan/chitin deacetylase (PgdA/CDA1 family)